ncbi:cyclopropane-fatty-acyl-phospholipid synthase family protein [Actinospica sp.]|uniref:cyclopropane-fatty-acyl-phospholipid synthase family protein n=1 Tax=Actinospica sp. TaxID=1872142 RepID=UPI002CD34DD6|nr:cyclopropane-fatty-acyl-phospholipid synthase family protein [Actinospica sp.]HWG28631.1 cyclopropane-fatty-acyl-phospholipid synthase family protein [Actinospica sp.]
MSTDERERTSARESAQGQSVAGLFGPLLRTVLGGAPPVRFEFWDDSAAGPRDGSDVVKVLSPDALRRMMWSPGELGLGRAYVAGDLDVAGDVFTVLRTLQGAASNDAQIGIGAAFSALGVARRLGALGLPPSPPPEEARPRGRRHSKSRDADAISHHYDVGNDFYRLFLGPSLTYSCARFTDEDTSLEDAQAAKHELISRKLGLDERPGMRLLDIGCGWGSMALHAAARYGAEVVGVTISEEQAAAARERVAEAGLSDQVEIRLQDYRDLAGETFDAVSSVGMFEHVGTERTAEYFTVIRSLLRPHGRLLNHAISSVGGSVMGSKSFIARYVFPDGELLDVGEVVLAMERAGFEVRDVESLREHYARTLRHWVANLEANWDEAVRLVGPARARIWRLYMAASALGFEDGGIAVHQVLGVLPDPAGGSGMPPTRRTWG